MMSTEQQATTPRFWRDPALPFVETREALDGRLLCYAKHSHECFSIGTITQGRSTYLNEKAREQVAEVGVVAADERGAGGGGHRGRESQAVRGGEALRG